MRTAMADLTAARLIAIAAVTGALIGGAVAAVVADATTSGARNTAQPAGASTSLTTTPVIRTDLSTTVQEGGSIGYGGSFMVSAPAGTSAQTLSTAQQAVTQDQEALAADGLVADDGTTADTEAVSAEQADVASDQGTLETDQAGQRQDCANATTSPACLQDAQKVAQDQSQLTQTQQQLASAQATETRDRDQNQSKVQSDQTKLSFDQANLAILEATATNPNATFTSLPSAGAVIRQNQAVYSVDDQAVPLLYGPVPAYRAFYVGMSDGADVGELVQDLITLGDGPGLTASDHYSTATATAVERWQRALGVPATGQVLLGQVVFEPGPIRVTSVTAAVGASAGGGAANGGGGSGTAVLAATSTTPQVTVALDVSQQYLVKTGDSVTVVLPNGSSTVGGHVTSVGTVATCPGGGGVGTGSGSTAGGGTPCSSSGGGSNATPTVTVTISLDNTSPLASLDQAPVNVNFTTETVDHVLAVPVNALLALQGGGYGVQVVTGVTSRLVGVTTGIYDSTLVQVSGSGITAGTRVEVPSA